MFRASAARAGASFRRKAATSAQARPFTSASTPKARTSAPKPTTSPFAARSASTPFPFPTHGVAASSIPSLNTLATRAQSTTAGAGGPALPALGGMIEAGDGDLEAILEAAGDIPVVVDFYANWCGPCKMLTPILTASIKTQAKTILVKINIDEAEQVAAKYEIASLPTVKAFVRGQEVDSFIGSRDRRGVEKFLEGVVGK
ncbi:thioredoxin-like protein [Fimicolochytrium jonesii]|uniref:thioredoxin-like protein n=1 Tax=Fimicolochytrium jonesii TaxID=1396493 RepID=UPI0022FE9A6B|nr:thioredoxin-like protein [Fimicolochytrium jonesii]KAI8815921.1 thioredoxin-like protein [Fimicolochytrium jonesii]